MSKRLNLICSILALVCMISMYMPVIAPRYPVGDYYAAAGTYEADYYLAGNYYCAREYWDMTRFAFATGSFIGPIALSLAQALLILWAWLSVRGEAGKYGLMIAVYNLAVMGFTLIQMLGALWMCRWSVLVMIVLDAVAAVVAAACARR